MTQQAIVNQQFVSIDNIPPVNTSLTNVYEVVRVQQGVVLFAELHFERFCNSLMVGGFLLQLSFNQWLAEMHKVIDINQLSEGNVRMDTYWHDKQLQLSVIKPIPHNYPTQLELSEGIDTTLQYQERSHPNAKITNYHLKGQASEMMQTHQVYETWLVNRDNCITEGSRSNFFAISYNHLITAPDSAVLPGIMRTLVIEEAQQLGIPINFKTIPVDQLPAIDAAFMTGTSPRVLPVRSINALHYNTNNSIIRQLQDAIEARVLRYIAQKKPMA
jgi:branched-chain amino acid aminotransferase